MERKLTWILIISLIVIFFSLAGFFPSYIGYFPDYGNFKWTIHIHFATFCCWFLLIVIQPILIRKKKFELHKKLGKLSYILMPVLVITILLLRFGKLDEELKDSVELASFNTFLTFADIISLFGYYLIAVLNSKNLRWHVAFILATTLVAFNPGLARLLNWIAPGMGMLVIFVPFIFTISVFMYEKLKLKRPILKSPYFTFFLLWLFEIILVFTIPRTGFWQNFVLSLAK